MTETPVPAVHFATSLVPHRSLSPEGFRWLIRGAVAANLLVGLPMLLLGACCGFCSSAATSTPGAARRCC
jgi:uncharacterized membrane protein